MKLITELIAITITIINKTTHVKFYLIKAIDMSERIINPLRRSVPYMARLAKILILILEGIIKNFSNERRDYESVDEKNLF